METKERIIYEERIEAERSRGDNFKVACYIGPAAVAILAMTSMHIGSKKIRELESRSGIEVVAEDGSNIVNYRPCGNVELTIPGIGGPMVYDTIPYKEFGRR